MARPKLKCDECSKLLANRDSLKAHLRIHTGERPFKCGHCDKAFKQKTHLDEHERIHTGEKPFACDLCQKTFTQGASLLAHKRTHSNLRPYKCKICAYSANKKIGLKRHEETHAQDESREGNAFHHIEIQKLKFKRPGGNELLYKCKSCGKSFSKFSSLRNHIRTHQRKTYKCNFCSFSTHWSSWLTAHERTHTGEKPFKCRFCAHSATQKHHIVNHERTHSKAASRPRHSKSVESKSSSFSQRPDGGLYCESSSRRRSSFVTRLQVLRDEKQIHEDSLKPSLEKANIFKRQHVSTEVESFKSRALKAVKSSGSCARVSCLGSIRSQNVAASASSNFVSSFECQKDNKRFSYSICRICKLVAENESEIIRHMNSQHRLPALSLVRVKLP